jgi:DNA polymerase
VATDAAFGVDAVVLGPPRARPTAASPDPVVAAVVEAERRPRPQAQQQVVEAAATAVLTGARLEGFGLPEEAGGGDRAEALARLDALHATSCPHCTTATAHTRLVFGEGNPEARLMFVGEAPGEVEDQLGRPFVGPAGKKLDEMIVAMGLTRESVYLANVLKSRPPNNRTPLQHEVDGCGPFLVEQIRIVRPSVLVTLGGPATKLLLGTELGITRLRGIWASFERPGISVPVMPTFHPAYLLRNYTPETRRQVWSDLKEVLVKLGARGAFP